MMTGWAVATHMALSISNSQQYFHLTIYIYIYIYKYPHTHTQGCNTVLRRCCVIALNKSNFLRRLAQLRESGVKARIRQQYINSPQPDPHPSSVVVSLVTVAPILVLLTAGNLIGLLILVIEKCVRTDILRSWLPEHIGEKPN